MQWHSQLQPNHEYPLKLPSPHENSFLLVSAETLHFVAKSIHKASLKSIDHLLVIADRIPQYFKHTVDFQLF